MVFESESSDIFSAFPSNFRLKKNQGILTSPLQSAQSDVNSLVETDNCIVLQIHQFRPAWAIQAYLRLSSTPYCVVNSSYPMKEPTGLLPQIHDGHFLVPARDSIAYLQTNHKDLDTSLSETEKADSLAYSNLITHQLQTILEYFQYIDEEGQNQTTMPLFQRVIPFPLYHILKVYFKQNSLSKIKAHGLDKLSADELIDLASSLYAKIERRLPEDEGGRFFFGVKPASVDAFLFAHVAEATNSIHLLPVVTKFRKLSKYFEHICQRFFSGDYSMYPPAMRSAMQRADYINSNNEFNQLEESCLSVSVDFIPELFGPQSQARNPQSQQETTETEKPNVPLTEDELKVRKENRRWYTGIGLSLIGYLLYRSDMFGFALSFGNDDDDDEEEDDDEIGG